MLSFGAYRLTGLIGMITETNTALDKNSAVKNPFGLKKIDQVEFNAGNAKQMVSIWGAKLAPYGFEAEDCDLK